MRRWREGGGEGVRERADGGGGGSGLNGGQGASGCGEAAEQGVVREAVVQGVVREASRCEGNGQAAGVWLLVFRELDEREGGG